jgi:arylsulfatase A-like enzyme
MNGVPNIFANIRRACLVAASIGATAPLAAAAESMPNVVVILGDDIGWGEFGVQGKKDIPTPHIDSIATDGVRFTQGYVSGPYCSPTRAGLLSGRYQTRFGHEFNEGGGANPNSKFGLRLDQVTLAKRLKDQGYATAAIGKWHLGAAPQFRPTARGFDEFYGTLANTPYLHPQLVDSRKSPDPVRVEDESYYTTDAYAERAVQWIAAHKDKPFFLYLPFNAQHGPLQPPQKYLDRFDGIANPKRKEFAATLSAFDDAVGDILATLKEQKLDDKTLVLFLSDNGGPTQQTTSNNLPLRGHKATTLEGGVRVPFFAKWPGKIPAGVVYDHPIIQLDIAPTALAAAGVQVDPSWKLEGVNLLPYVTGENSAKPHEDLFWRFGDQWAVRHGDWKLVASREDQNQAQLFNLANDKEELHDLSIDHPEKVAELRAIWEAWNVDNVPPAWKPKPQNAGNGQGRQARRRAASASAEVVQQ